MSDTPEAPTSTGLFPVGPANFIVKEANRWVSETEHWSDSQHELYGRSETLRLQNLWGEHYQERIAMAQGFVREWDKQCHGLSDFLNRTGLGNNSMIVTQVYMQAERLARRNGFKK